MPKNLFEQRVEIQKTVNKYFEDSIEIAPRAFSALNGWSRDNWDTGHTITALSVFEALVASSPAILTILSNAGVKVEKLLPTSQNNIPAYFPKDSLDWIFYGTDELYDSNLYHNDRYSEICESVINKISASKKITETDLFHAFLNTAYTGPIEFTEAVDGDLLSTCCSSVGDLLVHSGFCNPNEVIESGDHNFYSARSLAAEKFIELSKKTREIKIADPSHDLLQFAIWIDSKDKIRINPFSCTNLGKSLDETFEEETKLIFRDGIFQPEFSIIPSSSEDSILVLEDMIDNKKCSENDFQKFFEKNPELLAGIDYEQVHPQLVLFNDDSPNLIPDFFLEPLSSPFCDILDLKLPYSGLVRRLRNGTRLHFRSFINEAVSQLIEYRRYFEDKSNRENFYRRHGLRAYYPRMILVVGRRHDFPSDASRQELNQVLPKELDLWTYDDVLERAKKYNGCVNI